VAEDSRVIIIDRQLKLGRLHDRWVPGLCLALHRYSPTRLAYAIAQQRADFGEIAQPRCSGNPAECCLSDQLDASQSRAADPHAALDRRSGQPRANESGFSPMPSTGICCYRRLAVCIARIPISGEGNCATFAWPE